MLALALGVSLATGACGGDDRSDDGGARAALDAYLSAERTRDAASFCEALTVKSQRLVARDVARTPDAPRGASCVEAVSARFELAPDPPDYTTQGRIAEVRAAPARATFAVSSPMLRARDQRLRISLVRRAESWKVDLPAGGLVPPRST